MSGFYGAKIFNRTIYRSQSHYKGSTLLLIVYTVRNKLPKCVTLFKYEASHLDIRCLLTHFAFFFSILFFAVFKDLFNTPFEHMDPSTIYIRNLLVKWFKKYVYLHVVVYCFIP